MEPSILQGIAVTLVAGLIMGISPFPLKFMKNFKYEYLGLFSTIIALVFIPCLINLIFCPNLSKVFAQLKWGLVLKANLFSWAWGIAQVLAMLCFICIGVSLTYGILCAVGYSVGVILPMIFKASGIFSAAPGKAFT